MKNIFRIGEYVTNYDRNSQLFGEECVVVDYRADGIGYIYEISDGTQLVDVREEYLSRVPDKDEFKGLLSVVRASEILPPPISQAVNKCQCTQIIFGCRCEYGKLELERERGKHV